MSPAEQNHSPQAVIDRDDFQILIDSLKSNGYDVSGPSIRNDLVFYDNISNVDDLPIGWIDRQSGGSYCLIENQEKTLFGYVVGQFSWKAFLFPSEQLLMEVKGDGETLKLQNQPKDEAKRAFLGIRPCELQAIKIHDKVLTEGPYIDASYARRRENLFIIAVNCSRAGDNCFCVSMGTGPKASSGYDLAITEVIDKVRHYFLVESGSESGREFLKNIPVRDAEQEEIEAAEKATNHAAQHMGHNLDTDGLPELLQRNYDHSQWEEVGRRCLSCGNCTMVCPTCFCTTMEDRTDLTGNVMQRWRQWDSCHTANFSYIHGGSIRQSSMSRYRQWMMHKLAYWPEQFGTSGCVGCGRCITWCPVGIDLTEEAAAIRNGE